MKITNGLTGSAIAPDYEMLRTALLAIQAATPTARAAQPQDESEAVIAALHELFADHEGASRPVQALGHSFARRVPSAGEER